MRKEGQAGRKAPAQRGAVKHIQQTRVSDAEGREHPTGRGKEQKITEKKESHPNVKNRGMAQKGAEKRRPQ